MLYTLVITTDGTNTITLHATREDAVARLAAGLRNDSPEVLEVLLGDVSKATDLQVIEAYYGDAGRNETADIQEIELPAEFDHVAALRAQGSALAVYNGMEIAMALGRDGEPEFVQRAQTWVGNNTPMLEDSMCEAARELFVQALEHEPA